MASVIDDLKVKISVDNSDLKKSLKQSENAMVSFGKKVAGVAAGYFTLNAALKTFNNTITRTKELTEFADGLGLTASRFSELDVVVRKLGGTTEDLFDTIKDFRVKIGEAAEGTESMEESLRLLNLSSEELIKLKADEQFLRLADAVSSASDEVKLLALDQLVSDPGVRMIKILNQGGREINNMTREVKALGQSLSEGQVENLEAAAKAQRELAVEFEAFTTNLIAEFGPALVAILEGLNKVMTLGSNKATQLDKRIQFLESSIKNLKATTGEATSTVEELGIEMGNLAGEAGTQATIEEMALGKDSQGALDRMEMMTQRVKELREERALLNDDGSKKKPIDVGELDTTTFVGKETREEDLGLLEQYLRDQEEIREFARQTTEEQSRVYRERELDAEKKQAREMRMIWESGLKGRLQITSSILGQISNLMGSESRKMFEVGKAAAIAQVAIDTPKAAMSAYSAMAGIPIVGPALGAAAAAAAIATGVTQIQQIQSASFGGGGGAGNPGASVSSPEEQAQQEPTNVIDAVFNVQGTSFGRESFEGIAEGLNELVADGGEIRSVTVI